MKTEIANGFYVLASLVGFISIVIIAIVCTEEYTFETRANVCALSILMMFLGGFLVAIGALIEKSK